MRVSPQKAFFWSVISAIAILVLLSSCVTERQRALICKTCVLNSDRKDSIIERIVEVPVTLPPVPGPTVYLANPCAALCDSLGNLKPFTIDKTANGIRTTVKSNTVANTLDITSNLEDSTKTKARVPQREIYSTTLEQVPARCELRHMSDWDIFWGMVGKILTGIGVLYFGIILVRKRVFLR